MKRLFLFIPILLYFLPFPTKADAGLPILYLVWPPLLLSLIPVIFVEAWVLKKYLCISYRTTFMLSAAANCVSTLVGIPLVWFILLGIQIFLGENMAWDALDTWPGKFIAGVLQSAWVVPYTKDFYGLIPTAMITVFFIFFWASWFIETLIIRALIQPELKCFPIRKAVFWAQVASYTLLPIFIILSPLLGANVPFLDKIWRIFMEKVISGFMSLLESLTK